MLWLHGVVKVFPVGTGAGAGAGPDAAATVGPLDLHIARGHTTALMGPSGCGKSTLLRLMSGLLAPDAGSVVFDEALLSPANARAQRQRMGYMIQEGGLFPHLTCHANVVLMARSLRWPPAHIERRVEELLALTRLAPPLLQRFPAQLSGGERQRVALMRALMLDPPLLLLDEPLGALDPLVRFEVQHDLRHIFAALGKTVVLVTHDPCEAGLLADTLVLLRAGQVVQCGPLADFVQRPANSFVTRFFQAQRFFGAAACGEAAA